MKANCRQILLGCSRLGAVGASAQTRRDLAKFYPTYADFEPLKKNSVAYEYQPTKVAQLKEDGTPDIELLNDEFSDDYLAIKGNPRWVVKQTVRFSLGQNCCLQELPRRISLDQNALAGEIRD